MVTTKIFRNNDRDDKGCVVKNISTQIEVSNNISGVDDNIEGHTTRNSTSVNVSSVDIIYNVGTEEASASVLGCIAADDVSSARTVVGSRAVNYGNDTYAGAFALQNGKTCIDALNGEDISNFRRTCTTCSARTNNTEEVVEETKDVDPNDLMGLLRDEYSNGNNASESLASLPYIIKINLFFFIIIIFNSVKYRNNKKYG